MVDALEHHVIVVGFGRVGQAIARGLQELEHPYAVIDRNPDHEATIQAMGAIQVVGDATDQSVLDRAGIARADALVAAADQDDANLVVVLTARAARPELRIVSRVNEASWRERMRRAGADVAESPYDSYGLTLAAAAKTPGVLGRHHLPLLGLGTEEIELRADSPLVGMSIAAVGSTYPGVHVIGLRRENRLQRWEDVEGPLAASDVVVALGTTASLTALTAAESSRAPDESRCYFQ
jgi:voltage-gated potassium channel